MKIIKYVVCYRNEVNMMERKIGRLLKMISDRKQAEGNVALKKKNLTFIQSQVIRYLYHHGGKATQKDIETYLGVSHPTVVGIVSRMEKNGFLICSTDPVDRRQKNVEMTQAAADVQHQIIAEMKAADEKMLKGLSEEEVQELYRMLEIMYRNISEEAEGRKK